MGLVLDCSSSSKNCIGELLCGFLFVLLGIDIDDAFIKLVLPKHKAHLHALHKWHIATCRKSIKKLSNAPKLSEKNS